MDSNNNNKMFTLILVVILAVFIGAAIVSKQKSTPMMQEMMQQQSATLQALEGIQKNLGGVEGGDPSSIAAILMTQQDLQKRITALETKLDLVMGGPGGVPGKGSPGRQQGPPPEDYTKAYDIDVAHSMVKGNKNAKVTIVEFVDFQCPFCARFHPAINEVMAAYPNDVKYILKNYPLSFHPEAKPASKAAYAAGEQGKYWEMVDLILKDNSSLSADKFRELAKQLGLNMKKFEKDLKDNDGKWEKWIAADIALGNKIDVRGTPTFYLNGKKTVARSFDQYKTVIDNILKK